MALYYLDTSALVKLYIRESGTERLLQLVGVTQHKFAILALAQIEFHSAVRRRARAGDIGSASADEVLARFARHLEAKFLRQPVNEAVLETARNLVDRHPLRAYDAIQLAGCLVLRSSMGQESPVFVSADQDQSQAAEAEGLVCLNPRPESGRSA